MVQVLIGKENTIFNEDGARPQDEGEEQVDVDVVPGAVKLPVEQRFFLSGYSGTFLKPHLDQMTGDRIT